MGLLKQRLDLTPAGAAGSATASGEIHLHGYAKLYAIFIDYTSQPATTDVTITDSLIGTDLVQLNGNTDKQYYPRAAAAKSADGSASTLTEVLPIAERFQVAVAQGDPVANGVSVTVYYEP